MADVTLEPFRAAEARGESRLRHPRAVSAHYDSGRNRVIVRLTTGVEIGFAPAEAEGLESATADQLRDVVVEAFGLGIHFPKLDADLYVPALLDGRLGSEQWMTARAGRSKVRARRVNGRATAPETARGGRD